MSYFRNFLLIFLVVFFIDRAAPGMEISYFEQVPNIGADILFSAVVGFLNASVFPFYAIFEIKVTKLKLALLTFILSFGAFLLIAIVPFGVRAVSAWGVIIGGVVVWVVAFIGNYLEWQRDTKGS